MPQESSGSNLDTAIRVWAVPPRHLGIWHLLQLIFFTRTPLLSLYTVPLFFSGAVALLVRLSMDFLDHFGGIRHGALVVLVWGLC